MSVRDEPAAHSPAGAAGLRVLHVMECTIGGTRRHITDVARGQLERGLEVHLAVAAERQPDFRADLGALASLGARVHELPMAREVRPALDARHLVALERLLLATRPTIVHTHSSKGGVLGRLASLATGVGRRVHTPHTFAFLFREMFGPWKRRLYYELERGLAAHSAVLVAVSPSEARSMRSSGVVGEERIAVVPNGIDPAPFLEARPLALESVGLDPARPSAAVVGLLNVAKGQDLLLEALEQPGCESLQLLVAGSGELEPALRERTRRAGLEQRVRFLGFRRDVPALLAAIDFLVLPSRWEGMPYVALEALAAGKPVLATPVDGALDLLQSGGCGWLAREVSAGALAERLREVLALSPAERRAAGARGRALVLEAYTCERMVEGLVGLYRAIA